MSDEPKPDAGNPPPAKPTGGDPWQGKHVIIDPMTGERIFSPERAKQIDEELERQQARREKKQGTPGDA